jgi:UDP-N-acetylmuramoyl-tripeptide--D-alanyl-D-alanine ligase
VGDNITLIKVPDVEEAFWRFVEYYRGLFTIPVIGVTGTNGKTTTKEMMKHILTEKYNLNSTYRSKNSLSSNLKYLLRMDEKIEAGVFEMPVYCPGSLLKASRFLKPQVGIITNVGIDHIEGCRTLDSYIKAKAEFLEGIGNNGTIILNSDDNNIKKIELDKFKGNIIYFGFSPKSDFRVIDIAYTDLGTDFTFKYDNKNYKTFIPTLGEFNVLNALAAIAAVHTIGVEIQYAIDRLASFKNIEGHFERHRGINGSIVIDDTWNTNPSSSEAALKLFKQLSGDKMTITALGRMTLLAEYSDKYHIKIGKKVVELGIDKLITMDKESRMIGVGAIRAGMHPDNVYFCRNKGEVYSLLKRILDADSIVLLKATLEDSYVDLIDKITIKD